MKLKKKVKKMKELIDELKRPALEFHHEDLHSKMDVNQARIEAKLDTLLAMVNQLEKDVAVLQEKVDNPLMISPPVEQMPCDAHQTIHPYPEMTNFVTLGDA